MYCIVIVEPPWTASPEALLATARMVPLTSTPLCSKKRLSPIATIACWRSGEICSIGTSSRFSAYSVASTVPSADVTTDLRGSGGVVNLLDRPPYTSVAAFAPSPMAAADGTAIAATTTPRQRSLRRTARLRSLWCGCWHRDATRVRI